MKNNVLLIGIDGADWNFLKPWIDKGYLPNFKKWVSAGVHGPLQTSIPPMSCAAWATMFTGTNPGRHGIFEYVTDEGKLITSKSVKEEKIWEILSAYGKRCCIIGVTPTYPLEPLNGYMVSDPLTPPDEKIYSYPPELMALLNKHRYRITIKFEKYAFLPDSKDIAGQKEKILKECYDVFRRKYLTLSEIMDEKWDYFMFVFGETGTIHYLFWDRKEVILEFYKKIDYYLGKLIDKFLSRNDNTLVFIVSDHGYSSSPVRSFNFKVWLEKNGLLKDKRSFMQKLVPVTYKKLKKIPFSNLIFRIERAKEVRERFYRDTKKSANLYYKYPGIYINRMDYTNKEYDELRAYLTDKLRNLKDPKTNSAVFKIVDKRETFYSGKMSSIMPDLVLVQNKDYSIIFEHDSNLLFSDVKRHHPGRHFSDIYGIFLAFGAEIGHGTIDNARIIDLFPTILHILNISIPKNAEGIVLREIFSENSELFKKKTELSEKEDIAILQEKNRIKEIVKKVKI